MIVPGVDLAAASAAGRPCTWKPSGELVDVAAHARGSPSASAEMRSLSLTRSSCAPVTRSSPPCVASAASTGSSSMTPGTSAGRDLGLAHAAVP